MLHTGADPSRLVAALVRFTPGARTNWHSHPLGQTLHCTDGTGLVATRDGNAILMRAGDTVHTPPGEEHWHGATADTMMCHLALVEHHGGQSALGRARQRPRLPGRQPQRCARAAHNSKENSMENVTLNNGVQMPILGFGVYQIPDDETQAAVEAALATGYRHLDTAAAYGNEEAVGAAIKASGIAREDLFVTTKLWIQHAPAGNVEEDTKRSFEQLPGPARPGLCGPVPDPPAPRGLLQRMAGHAEAEQGGPGPCHRCVELPPRPAGGPDRPQRDRPGRQPDRNPPLPPARRRPGTDGRTRRPDRVLGPVRRREERPVHQSASSAAIAEKPTSKSVAQVVLRWLTQRGVVVIPKSVRPERMAQNLDIFDFTLTEEQMSQIATLDTGASLFFDHRDPAMVSWLGGRRIS